MGTKPLFSKLPFDIIREILLYDQHFVVRKQDNSLVYINKIPKIDKRFFLYDNICKIKEIHNKWFVVLVGKNKKFIICHTLTISHIWDYSFLTFSKDPHTNMISSIPDSVIEIPLYNL